MRRCEKAFWRKWHQIQDRNELSRQWREERDGQRRILGRGRHIQWSGGEKRSGTCEEKKIVVAEE